MLVYIVFIIVVILLIANKNKIVDGFSSDINQEALYSLSSMYKDGNLKITTAEVTKDLTVDGNILTNGTISSVGNISTKGIISSDATDFVIGKGHRTDRGDCGNCRALVHDGNNTLAINYSNDFTGGTSIYGKMAVTGDTHINGTIYGTVPIKDGDSINKENRGPSLPNKTTLDCPVGQVMCGIEFGHESGAPWWNESVKIKCCTLGQN